MFKKLYLALLLLLLKPCAGQIKGIKSYKQLSVYADTMVVAFPKIGSITATAASLDQNHADSLKLLVFKVLEDKPMDKPFKIYANQQMAVMAYQLMGDLDLALHYQQKEIELIKTTSDSSYLMMAYTRLMFILKDMGKADEAYEISLRVSKLLDSAKDGINKVFTLRQLCVFYNVVNDNERAKTYCQRGIELNENMGQIHYMGDFYNALVEILDKTQESHIEDIPIRKKAIRYARLNNDSLALHNMYINLARSLATIGQTDSAIKYYELGLKTYQNHPFLFGWVGELSDYGRFLIECGKLERAKEILDTVSVVVNSNTVNPTALEQYYLFQSVYYASQGQVEEFNFWLNRRDSLVRADYDTEKAKSQEEMAAKYETEKKEAENQLLRSRNQNKLLIIVGLAMLILLLVILIIQSLRLRQREKLLLQNQIENERSEKERSLAHIKSMRKELEVKIKQATEQQIINFELMELVEELKTAAELPIVKKKASQMKVILGERAASQLYNEILEKMQELYPELLGWLKKELGKNKEAQIIFTSMYFMGYETRDIASLLQRTEKAIWSIRYRARKKMALRDQDDLVAFLKAKNQELTQK